jgi:hypothetical protein
MINHESWRLVWLTADEPVEVAMLMRRSRNWFVALAAVAAVAAWGGGAGLSATPAWGAWRLGPAAGSAGWVVVGQPRLAVGSALDGIAVVSGRLAWAAGGAGFSGDGRVPGRPVMERWNGRVWSVARLPALGNGAIAAVAASSAVQAWAVDLGASSAGIATMLRWDGQAWRKSPAPVAPGTADADLGLAAAPGGRAWLITTEAPGPVSAVIFGWNGTRWTSQSYPCPSYACNLYRVSARAGNDAWAVGNYVTGSGTGSSLAVHWTGRGWQMTNVPYVKNGFLTGVYPVSKTDAWAVGGVFLSSQALLYHWDGTSWHRVRPPAGLTAPPLGELTGITGDPAGDLWIYGFAGFAGGQGRYMRYHNGHWTMITDQAIAGQTQAIVRAVATVPGTSAAWSVGLGLTAHLTARARIERYGRL